MIPYPRVNCLKTIPLPAAHTYIAHVWQYPPPPGAHPPVHLSASLENQGEMSHYLASVGACRMTLHILVVEIIDSCQNRVSADQYQLTI